MVLEVGAGGTKPLSSLQELWEDVLRTLGFRDCVYLGLHLPSDQMLLALFPCVLIQAL
jgi:hypothetical protein